MAILIPMIQGIPFSTRNDDARKHVAQQGTMDDVDARESLNEISTTEENASHVSLSHS